MSKPRVLIYDIETTPILGYTWGIWQQDVIKVKEDWQILSVAWKFLGDRGVQVVGQDDFPDYKPGVIDDRNVVEYLHGLFDQADIVIAHNGDSFDQKKARARMITLNMAPPSPYKELDTKKIAKRVGAFTSNRLGDLAKQFGVAQKGSPGGFETWEGCMAGNPRAWARMKKYNKQDIPPLEDIYKKLLPWINNHPSMAVLSDRPDACPKCGSTEGMLSRGLTAPTKTGRYRRYQCKSCWGWCQARKSEKLDIRYVN
jgi:hypothetical protein